jgi:hypothetical protein
MQPVNHTYYYTSIHAWGATLRPLLEEAKENLIHFRLAGEACNFVEAAYLFMEFLRYRRGFPSKRAAGLKGSNNDSAVFLSASPFVPFLLAFSGVGS